MESIAKFNGQEDQARILRQTALVYTKIHQFPASIIITSSSDTPSRQDNPYRAETNLQLLKEKLTEAKRRVEQVIIEQRNHDTAVNIAQALQDEQRSTGVVIFGADHESGLVQELQKQNLHTIVITPSTCE